VAKKGKEIARRKIVFSKIYDIRGLESGDPARSILLLPGKRRIWSRGRRNTWTLFIQVNISS
jgi:hypothetical protein